MTLTQKAAVERLAATSNPAMKTLLAVGHQQAARDILELLSLIASLEQDKARLDWLEAHVNTIDWSASPPRGDSGIYPMFDRQALDAAMKGAV